MKALAMALLMAGQLLAAESVIDCVEVKTRAKENAIVKVWYRVPQGYDANAASRSKLDFSDSLPLVKIGCC